MSSKDKIATIIFRIFIGVAALTVFILVWPKDGQIPLQFIVLGALFFGYALGGDKLAIFLLRALRIKIHDSSISSTSSQSGDEIRTSKNVVA